MNVFKNVKITELVQSIMLKVLMEERDRCNMTGSVAESSDPQKSSMCLRAEEEK